MQVVLPGDVVIGPETLLLVREHDALRAVCGRLVDPDIPVAVGRVAAASSALKPRVLVGGVVDDQVGDHPHAAVARCADEFDEVPVAAQPLVHPVEIGDVVAVVTVGGRVVRHQPHAGHTQTLQVVDALDQSAEVAVAVTVTGLVGRHVKAIDDGGLPPQV